MDGIINLASTVGSRFTTNVQSSLANMSPEKWIRVVIVAGAYLLLRPYLIKLGSRAQMQTHERDAAEMDAAAKAPMSPNELRGRVQIPEDSDSDGDNDGAAGGQSSAADWGKKARRRQRDMIKKLLEAEERRLQESKEEEEDKDIEEFLVKE